MRVVSFNANGLRAAHRKGVADFLGTLEPDVVCFQELKAQPPQLPGWPGYHPLWHCAERPGYSGVGILSRRAPDRTLCGVDRAAYDLEGRVARADFGSLSVVSVYVPSGTSGEARQRFKMDFLAHFREHVAGLLAEGRELVLCGDFNIAHEKIDLKNWRSNQGSSGFLPEERAWFSSLLELGLVDTVRAHLGPERSIYSWWSLRSGARARDVGWRLDYQLATPGIAARVTGVSIPREPVFSDHAPVVVDYGGLEP